MGKLTSFRDLQVWQNAMDVAEGGFGLAKRLPAYERFVLGTAICKSGVSVPSNIAEGFGRHFTAAYVNHLWIANGSNNELQTQLMLASRVATGVRRDAEKLITDSEEVGRMMRGLAASLDRERRK
jgi:four helix bundle protein